MSATALAVLSFALFYAVSSASMLEPYAPSALASFVMRYGVAILILGTGLYFGFIHKWPSWGESSWARISRSLPSPRAKWQRLVVLVVCLGAFAVIVAFGTQRWLAFPTKWMASDSVSKVAHCETAASWGKRFRGEVMIEGTDQSTGDRIDFPWPSSLAPKCPGSIVIVGRQSPFGIYVTAVR